MKLATECWWSAFRNESRITRGLALTMRALWKLSEGRALCQKLALQELEQVVRIDGVRELAGGEFFESWRRQASFSRLDEVHQDCVLDSKYVAMPTHVALVSVCRNADVDDRPAHC